MTVVRRCGCGAPIGPLQNWCSERCFYEDEPGVRGELDDDFATQDDERDF